MRILIVAESFFPDVDGGSGRFVFEAATRLSARGHRVTLLGERRSRGLAREDRLRGVRVVRYGSPSLGLALPWSFTSLFLAHSEARSIFEKEHFDLVWGHHYSPGLGGFVLARRKGVPTLYTYHASRYIEWVGRAGQPRRFNSRTSRALLRWWADSLYSKALLYIEKGCLARSGAITVLSRFSERQLEGLHPRLACRARVVPAGVDTERFRPLPDRRSERMALGLPEEAPVLLTVRRLIARMGLEHLIDAMPAVLDEEPRACLLVGGKGDLHGDLKDRIARRGLSGSVRLLGYIDDSLLPKYYAVSDLFVLPTLSLEGFGMVTLEALACGTPVLGSRVGATPEILQRLDKSLLLDSTEPGHIASSITDFLKRKDTAELRARCRSFAVEHYSWNAFAERIERIMEELAGGA